jgi:hypothetical protein
MVNNLFLTFGNSREKIGIKKYATAKMTRYTKHTNYYAIKLHALQHIYTQTVSQHIYTNVFLIYST